MKLMNSDSEVPAEFYIFVNHYYPVTVHNLSYTGGFLSSAFVNWNISEEFKRKYEDGTADYLPFVPANTDGGVISSYCLTAMNDYRVEYDAEVSRKMYYPKYPSRFSAVFAFGDYETCQKVAKKHYWDLSEVKKFRLLGNPLNRVIRVNMEVISLVRHAYRFSMSSPDDLNSIWNHYWQGKGNLSLELPQSDSSRKVFHSGEIFEYLIEGRVILV